jgi:hypothetical protein
MTCFTCFTWFTTCFTCLLDTHQHALHADLIHINMLYMLYLIYYMQVRIAKTKLSRISWRMLTYADVCWRVLTCADVCWRMLTYADVCWRMLTYADAGADSQDEAVAHLALRDQVLSLLVLLCWTGTTVQILTQRTLLAAQEPRRPPTLCPQLRSRRLETL